MTEVASAGEGEGAIASATNEVESGEGETRPSLQIWELCGSAKKASVVGEDGPMRAMGFEVRGGV